MLFQRLYNWIKYKTLPPSTLFKNRLFIERDNKNRRIVSNFGISYRNSKWSNYSNYNIKLSFKKNYFFLLCAISGLFFVFLFSYNFKNYYLLTCLYNGLFSFFWAGVDVLDYHVSYAFWAISGFFSIAINSIYSYFFFNNFSRDNTKNNSFFEKKIIVLEQTKTNKLHFDKNDINWLLISFLNNSASRLEAVLEKKFIEDLFENSLNLKKWSNSFDLYLQLFKATYFFNLLNSSTNALFNNKYFKAFWHQNQNWFINSHNPDLAIFLFECHKKYGPIISLKLKEILKKILNLRAAETKNLKNNFLINNKIGLFFLTNLSQNELTNYLTRHTTLISLTNCFEEQIKILKINRWIYRYSILGRKILKNSHKLTLSKKILDFNLFAREDFTKNLWMSEHAGRVYSNSKQSFNLFNNLNYNAVPTNSIKQVVNKKTIKVKSSLFLEVSNWNLNFYEQSYFWLLKRFYFFNSNFANNINFIKQKVNFSWNLNQNTLFNQKLLNDNYFSKETQPFFLMSPQNEINFSTKNKFDNIFRIKFDSYLNYNNTEFFFTNNLNNFSYFFNSNFIATNKIFNYTNTNTGANNDFLQTLNLSVRLSHYNKHPINQLIFLNVNYNDLYKQDAVKLTLFK